ncbi:sodium-coupled monocarboxylate transporter 1 [Megalobrama amblycephala]|uniref:sodium-coupled monocarboxylate transporter 1 n=1 Tax=Megalobrama amblycephala TaxID=75352 RepID=UPI00201424CB|nr:sodium-coupled monocarboxylate transporter 1 [Megalobrama amblycephala]
MCTKMLSGPTFNVWDYVVFTLMLVISAGIGVYYAFAGRGQSSSADFLVGGRSMTAVPVALSLTASFMSAITVLGTPVEVYQYGAIFILICFSYALMVAVSSEIFLPIFYRLGITSTYEYLEMRYNKVIRLFGTVLFIIQTVLYTGLVIYAPALALNQVTGVDLWGAVMSTGVVCTLYCTIGGLKAVVWTDVFQVGIILAGLLAVIIQSVLLQGGISTIISDSSKGGRLNLWDFDPNPLRRHTFWSITVGGTFLWTSVYGINQAQVQRYVSCKSLFHAKMALYINLVCLWAISICSVFCGLCLYSIYKNCDPWTAKKVSAQDQLMPYLVLDILSEYPGLPGLFVAAAYSGTLSTVSSSVNALAAVTITDLMRPYLSLSERQLSWASKGMSVFYGAVCIGMAGLASLMGGMLQAAISIVGVVGGPLLGLFSLGILFPCANTKGGLAGLLSGLVLSLWVCIGAQIYPPQPENSRPLPLTTHGCNFSMAPDGTNWTANMDNLTMKEENQQRPFLADNWYSLSYLYFGPLGTVTVIAVGLIISILSGGRQMKLQPGLTLSKEDLTCYKVYNVLKEKVSGRSGKLDLVQELEKSFGKTNFAFCEVELSTQTLP